MGILVDGITEVQASKSLLYFEKSVKSRLRSSHYRDLYDLNSKSERRKQKLAFQLSIIGF